MLCSTAAVRGSSLIVLTIFCSSVSSLILAFRLSLKDLTTICSRSRLWWFSLPKLLYGQKLYHLLGGVAFVCSQLTFSSCLFLSYHSTSSMKGSMSTLTFKYTLLNRYPPVTYFSPKYSASEINYCLIFRCLSSAKTPRCRTPQHRRHASCNLSPSDFLLSCR